MTEIRKRWSKLEDSVLRSSLAAKVGTQNIADFLDRDVKEVIERIAYLTNQRARVSSQNLRRQTLHPSQIVLRAVRLDSRRSKRNDPSAQRRRMPALFGQPSGQRTRLNSK